MRTENFTLPDPILMTVKESRAFLGGMSNTSFYEHLAAQRIRARKLRRRTLIETASLREFADALPAMQSRDGGAA